MLIFPQVLMWTNTTGGKTKQSQNMFLPVSHAQHFEDVRCYTASEKQLFLSPDLPALPKTVLVTFQNVWHYHFEALHRFAGFKPLKIKIFLNSYRELSPESEPASCPQLSTSSSPSGSVVTARYSIFSTSQ